MTLLAALLSDTASLWILLVIVTSLVLLAWHQGPDR